MGNKESLAARLNGREIGDEITSEEEKLAKTNGLVVIFGASDDLCELRGAIEDEVGCYDGGTVFIGRDGKILQEIDDDDREVLEKYGLYKAAHDARMNAIQVEAEWCEVEDYSWTYSTTTPHATFDILEDGEPYCRGIVIDLNA